MAKKKKEVEEASAGITLVNADSLPAWLAESNYELRENGKVVKANSHWVVGTWAVNDGKYEVSLNGGV